MANEKLFVFIDFPPISNFVCVRACGEPTAKMLESKKPSQLIKKLHTNEVALKVHLLDDSSHVFNVKVSESINCIRVQALARQP